MTYRQDTAVRNPNATQAEQARSDQVKNAAGGFVFSLGKWDALDRFLILGTADGTFYASQRQATRDIVEPIKECFKEDGLRVVNRAAEISDAGRAMKNEPAILVLSFALADDNVETRRHAVKMLPQICRIGTHILTLCDYMDGQRGWGRIAQKAIREWFRSKSTKDLAYQAIKYKSRGGWSLRDLLRKSHYTIGEEHVARRSVLEYITHPDRGVPSVEVIQAARCIQEIITTAPAETGFKGSDLDFQRAAAAIRSANLPREAVPTEMLNSVEVWEALLGQMPMTAMIRNLGKMSSIGLIKPMSDGAIEVAKRLVNVESLKRARIHPLSLLIAYAQYGAGHGDKGSLSWAPAQEVVAALEEAYYKAFDFVEPTGLRYYLAIDISGSMGNALSGLPITCAQGAACMASVTHSVEKRTYVAGFASGDGEQAVYGFRNRTPVMKPMPMHKHSLGEGVTTNAFGATDCAAPMLDAMEKGIEVDVFCAYTDNQTFYGDVHPYRALQMYRDKTGIPAKLVVIGMTATNFSIADPKDSSMLDVVGFSTDTPSAIAAFARG